MVLGVELKSVGYWDLYYEQDHPDLAQPSSFARYCAEHLTASSVVFEIGCGSGRDALFLARLGLRVFGSDASEIAIDRLSEQSERAQFPCPPRWIARSMEELDDRHAGEIDAVYMRFILHAVSADTASRGLAWAARNLQADGLIFIEARSVLGSLYGEGVPVERDAFFHDGHYRRFLRVDELTEELESLGFELESVVERDGLAVHEDDDPVVIRVVARRQ